MNELSHPATDLVMWIENTRGYNETVQTINATMARRWIRDEFDLDGGIKIGRAELHAYVRGYV